MEHAMRKRHHCNVELDLSIGADDHRQVICVLIWWQLTAYLQNWSGIRTLEDIKHGELRIVTPTEVLVFGKPDNDSLELNAELHIRNAVFWTRVLLSNDLGFAEAFMYGDGKSGEPKSPYVTTYLQCVYSRL